MAIWDNLVNLWHKPPPMDMSMITRSINSTITSEWTTKVNQYRTWWDWFEGSRFAEQVTNGNLKYPLKMNPIQWVALKHGGFLYGEIPDDADSLVQMTFKTLDNKTDDSCKRAKNIINRVWSDSNGASIQLENAIISQFLGGCVYKINYWPWNKMLTYGIQITRVMPDYIMPVWSVEDPEDMSECYVMYYITPEEALNRWGVKTRNKGNIIYKEHWTRNDYEITVDNQAPSVEGLKPSGDNPWGVVPIVYIPHQFRMDGHYGMSHVDGLTGMIEELNSRMADRGDGIKNATVDRPVVTGTPSQPKLNILGENTQYIHLGGGAPGSTKTPNMYYLEPNSVKMGDQAKQFVDDMWHFICKASDTPPIAWGDAQQGSQRSGMSLEVLYMSFINHLRMERIMHRSGHIKIAKMVMRIINSLNGKIVTDEMMLLDPHTKWARITPRDRMDLVNELTLRRQVQLADQENSLRRLDEQEGVDVDEELENIQAEQQEIADQKVAQAKVLADQKMNANNAAASARGSQDKKPSNPAQGKP